jgi:hypothetical protein
MHSKFAKSVSMTYIFSSKSVWAKGFKKTKNFIQIPIRWKRQKKSRKKFLRIFHFLQFFWLIWTLFWAHFKCFEIRIKFCVFWYPVFPGHITVVSSQNAYAQKQKIFENLQKVKTFFFCKYLSISVLNPINLSYVMRIVPIQRFKLID